LEIFKRPGLFKELYLSAKLNVDQGI